MLAALAAAARPHGARRWDAPGVMAAISKVKHLELAEVGMALFRAARDRDLETPAAIGNTGSPCWIERPVERPTPTKATLSEPCGECSVERHQHGRFWAPDEVPHEWVRDRRSPAGSAVGELRDVKLKAMGGNE